MRLYLTLILAIISSVIYAKNIDIHLSPVAGLKVKPEKLILIANSNSPEVLTVTNTSTSVTAKNLYAYVEPYWTEVSQDDSDCKILEPGNSCNIYLAAGEMISDQHNILISGDNVSSAQVEITVDDLVTSILKVDLNNVITLSRYSSRWKEITINNTSPSVTATNILPDFTGIFSNSGIMAQQYPHDCTKIAPGQSCIIKFKLVDRGFSKLERTKLPIYGDNTTTVTPFIEIVPFQIGDEFGGGKVGCLPLHGEVDGLITTKANMNSYNQWGGYGKSIGIGAQSKTDGRSNTSLIINTLGHNIFYAAETCATYEIDDAGNSPCQSGRKCYNDWFLPAQNQLRCLIGNKSEIGGFYKGFYWSSTEKDENHAAGWHLAGFPQDNYSKNESSRVRCVRNYESD